MRHVDFDVKSLLLTFCAVVFLASVAFAESSSEARLAFGRELDRTTRLSDTCVPTREHLEKGELHAVTFAGYREPETVLTVHIEKDRGAVHLFLYTHQDILWRLLVEEGSSVDTVYTIGPNPTAVLDLPQGTLAYSIAYDEADKPFQDCKPSENAAAELANAAFYYSWTPERHRVFEDALETYASQEVSSLVLIDPDKTVGVVSATSIKKTHQIRNDGEAVLRNTHLPGNFVASNAAIAVPPGLTSTELNNWLLETGAAETAGEEVLDFLCLREKVAYWVVGMDTSVFGSWCESKERWDASRRLVLQRPIDVGDGYRCGEGKHIIIYTPNEEFLRGRLVDCSISIVRFDLEWP